MVDLSIAMLVHQKVPLMDWSKILHFCPEVHPCSRKIRCHRRNQIRPQRNARLRPLLRRSRWFPDMDERSEEHGSLVMSPLNITQPLGIWSIMATIRWCPIFPKWDSYQPSEEFEMFFLLYVVEYISHDGSMVLVYMLTFIGGILMGSMLPYIYISYMDPVGI